MAARSRSLRDFVPSEHTEQVLLFEWAALRAHQVPVLKELFAVPNFSGRLGRVPPVAAIKQAQALNAEGRKPGIEDVILLVPHDEFHGLLIELKCLNAVPSDVTPEQVAWHMTHRSRGYAVGVCRGWEAAATLITDYLEVPSIRPPMARRRSKTSWQGWSGED